MSEMFVKCWLYRESFQCCGVVSYVWSLW